MFKSKKFWICLVLSIAIIIFVPLILDWVIIGNDFPSNITNSDWVGFFGGYIGALMGAIVSLIGIIITIRYTNEQNKKDRELQIRPYCIVRHVNDNKLVGTQKILAECQIGCEPQNNNGPEHISIIYIKNIGLGPAIDFSIYIDKIDDGRKHFPILTSWSVQAANSTVNHLQPGEEAAFPIHIHFNFDPITADDVEEIEGLGKTVKISTMQKYKNFDLKIKITYHDMYNNEYSQKIILASNMSVSGDSTGVFRHTCSIHLKEASMPIKPD